MDYEGKTCGKLLLVEIENAGYILGLHLYAIA